MPRLRRLVSLHARSFLNRRVMPFSFFVFLICRPFIPGKRPGKNRSFSSHLTRVPRPTCLSLRDHACLFSDRASYCQPIQRCKSYCHWFISYCSIVGLCEFPDQPSCRPHLLQVFNHPFSSLSAFFLFQTFPQPTLAALQQPTCHLTILQPFFAMQYFSKSQRRERRAAQAADQVSVDLFFLPSSSVLVFLFQHKYRLTNVMSISYQA